MNVIFVVTQPDEWPFDTPGSSFLTAHEYLVDSSQTNGVDTEVVNLSSLDRYQGHGYYVSLLAEARGHNPLPKVKTVEDLQSAAHVEMLAGEIDALAQDSLRNKSSEGFVLDAYFGQDPSKMHAALAQQLFTLAPVPLLRAEFQRRNERWRLVGLSALGLRDIEPGHRAFLHSAAIEYVSGRRGVPTSTAPDTSVPAVAILVDETETDRPSNDAALRKFVANARNVGLRAEIIGPDALEKLAEFDGLFIRTTTNVAHYTYEFSRHAAALGLPVIDDPESILKCTNKVFLHEIMARHGIPTPRTIMVHRENIDEVIPALGLPCILKKPDGGFGVGVAKIETEDQLKTKARELLETSELLIAQEWLPTEFDWRVTILDQRPLFVCKYFMAPGHWQVVKHDPEMRVEGRTTALAITEAPEIVITTALRGANLIGRGLYGVDLKQVAERCYLIEVNDNPNIDAGNEDQVLGDALYREVMGLFARRIAQRRGQRHVRE